MLLEPLVLPSSLHSSFSFFPLVVKLQPLPLLHEGITGDADPGQRKVGAEKQNDAEQGKPFGIGLERDVECGIRERQRCLAKLQPRNLLEMPTGETGMMLSPISW